MSEASNKLARSRLAIIEHVHRRERRHERESTDDAGLGAFDYSSDPSRPVPPRRGGWWGRVEHAVRTWWRYHPAQMAVEMVAPVVQSYARKNPGRYVGAAAAAGAVLMWIRPWKIVSISTLIFALLKSSQISSLILSAMSAANYEDDNQRPGGGA